MSDLLFASANHVVFQAFSTFHAVWQAKKLAGAFQEMNATSRQGHQQFRFVHPIVPDDRIKCVGQDFARAGEKPSSVTGQSQKP